MEFEEDSRNPRLFEQLDERNIVYGAEHEYNLLWAILLRALLDACGTTSENVTNFAGDRRAAKWREQARWYIFSDYQWEGFNFLSVCEHLRLDPGRVRRAVRDHADDWSLFRLAQTALSYEAVVRKFVEGACDD